MSKRMSFLLAVMAAFVSVDANAAVGSANPVCVANEHTLSYYCPAEASNTINGKLLESETVPFETMVTVKDVTAWGASCLAPNDQRFDGWTDEGGTGYIAGNQFSMPDHDMKLTAHFVDNYVASIVYDTNYGKINDATYSTSCTTTSLSIVLPTDVTRVGYTFKGWLDKNGNKVDAINKSDCIEGAIINLTASWTANTIKVTFDANGASGTNVAGREFEYDAQIYAPGAGSLTKKNHVFLGWAKNKDATSADYAVNASLTNINNGGDITLYAVWSPCDAAIKGSNVASAELVGVDGNVCQYKHVCNVGYYNANHDKTIASNEISCASCSGLPTNAVWTGASTTAGGCAWDCNACVAGDNAESCNVTKNESARTCTYTGTCSANTFKPTVNGVTVSCAACPTNSMTDSGNSATSCTCIANYSVGGTMNGATTTTSAQCSPITYTISYDLGGGATNYTGAPATYTYGVGATINGVPTRAGYVFGGWCDSGNTNCEYTRTIGTTDTGAKTFVAKWTQATCNATNATASAAVADNKVVCAVTCNYGFTQGGAGDTTKTFTVIGEPNVATVDVACKRATHTITISKNGGSGDLTVDNNVSSGADDLVITCNHGATITLPAWGGSVNALTKSGSVFTGWDNTSVVCDSDKTVNAQWETCGTCVKGTGVESCMVDVSKNTCVASVTQCQSGYDSTKAGCDGMNCSCDASNIACDAGEYLAAGATACTPCVGGNYCVGGTYTFSTTIDQGTKSCPNGYKNSVVGSKGITDCYSDTKQRAWTGKQVNGVVPENCAAVTEWNACSIDACDYVAYSNAAGTGDGTIKSGCATNNTDCTKTVKSVTANKNAYVNGTTCAVCAAPYAMSDGGNITSDKCYGVFEKSGVQVQGTVPTNCSAVTAWNTCNPGTCEYTKYANGDIKADCVPQNCTQTPKTVTANAGAHINGTACEMCPSEYPESAGGAIESGMCYRACVADDVDGAASVTGTATKGGTNTCKATSCASGRYFESGACKTLDGYTCPGGTYGKDKCFKSCTVSCTPQTCPNNAATCTNGTETATGTEYYGGACDATAPTCSLVVNKCKSGFLLKNNACTTCPANATCDGSYDWVCDTNYNKTSTGCALGVFTCAVGKAADGSTCAPGSYCPGGNVDAGMENDSLVGCERTCPDGFENSDAGAINENACYKTVAVSSGAVPANCASATWNGCEYQDHFGIEDTVCTPTVKSVTANKNAYVNGTACEMCAAPHAMSDGGNITSDKCYGVFTKSGEQVHGAVPENCSSVTAWNTCEPETCEYTKYANGNIKADCTPKNCTQTPKTVTANIGAYVSGTTCEVCSGNTYQPNDNSSANSCAICGAGYTANDGKSACDANNYTITYSCGDGQLASGADTTQDVVYDATFTTRPASICERTGYTFVRWNGEYSSANTEYTYTTVGNTTLTAQWTAVKTQITLDNASATTAGTTPIYAQYNTNVWLDSAHSKAMTTSENGITVPVRKYTVTYHTNGGHCSIVSHTAIYTFNGYYSATSGGTQYIDANGKITSSGLTAAKALKADATWYAQWTSASVTLPTVATRAGYTLNGWSTTHNATSGLTGSYTPTANVILHAAWAPNTYTISLRDYDQTLLSKIYEKYGNGWYSDSGATIALSKASVPTRSGYKFRGFYIPIQPDVDENGGRGERVITNDGTLPKNTRFDKDYTLYAAWAKDCTKPSNGTCSLTINSNGTATYTASCDTGYTVSGATTATPSCNADCNAITLDANGGTAGSVAQLYKKAGATGYYTDSSCSTAYSTTADIMPTRSGYTFRGFYVSDPADVSATETNGVARYITHTGEATSTGTNWTVNAPETLYAGWARNCEPGNQATCTLTVGQDTTYTTGCNAGYNIKSGSDAYNPVCQGNTITLSWANGGRGTTPTSPSSCTYGNSFTMPSAMTATGYTFNKWSVNSKTFDAGASVTCNSTNLGVTSGAATITGTWNANKYTVVFNKGANSATGTMSNQEFTYDVAQNLRANAFANSGLNFQGWATSSNGAVVYSNGQSVKNLSVTNGATINLYAVWGDADIYTIAYVNVNNATHNNPTTYTVRDTIDFADASMDGYTFAGWFADTAYKTQVYGIDAGTTGNKTFYAKWAANNYTITYSCGDGQLASGADTTQDVVYDATFTTRPASICGRKGYTFVRWNGEYSSANTEYTYTTVGDTTLTAQWTANTYTCDAGEYLAAGATACTPCVGGNYCVGGTYTFSAIKNQGIEACSAVAPNSDAGAMTSEQCYAACSVPNNVETVVGRDYDDSDDASDTCQIQTCKPGYYLNNNATACVLCPADNVCDAVSGSDMNLDNVPDGAPVTCDELTSGTHTMSNAGSVNVNRCYTTCSEYAISGGVARPDAMVVYFDNVCTYYGVSDTGNPCEIVTVNGVQTCREIKCNPDYELVGGKCEPCDRANATDYLPGGNCQVASCHTGFHPVGDECVTNVRECSVSNAIYAEQVWDEDAGRFGACVATECDDGYHVESGACATNTAKCDIEHGTGMREWDERRGTWGECVATSCDAGYTSDAYESDEPGKQCGRCRNATGIMGEIAVSSYASGCTIATCMYQGELYNLENNECVPICPMETYEDETGTMRWNPKTKKCERTCFEGYMSW